MGRHAPSGPNSGGPGGLTTYTKPGGLSLFFAPTKEAPCSLQRSENYLPGAQAQWSGLCAAEPEWRVNCLSEHQRKQLLPAFFAGRGCHDGAYGRPPVFKVLSFGHGRPTAPSARPAFIRLLHGTVYLAGRVVLPFFNTMLYRLKYYKQQVPCNL